MAAISTWPQVHDIHRPPEPPGAYVSGGSEPEQQFYLAKLLGFDYDIQYKAGSLNVVADSLSHIDSSTSGQCLILSVPHHDFMLQLNESLEASPEFQQERAAIHSHP